jgi:hypothetical protein
MTGSIRDYFLESPSCISSGIVLSYNFGNLGNTVAAVGINIRSPGFKSGGDSPSAFIGVPWKM